MKLNMALCREIPEFWAHWGFEPWEWEGLEGVWRQVDFKKSALLGQVALYHSWDFIVWKHEGLLSKNMLLQKRQWVPDLMTQRFLLLGDQGDSRPGMRSFCWGFRGFVEVFRHVPGSRGHRKFRDLADLVNAVQGYVARREELQEQSAASS